MYTGPPLMALRLPIEQPAFLTDAAGSGLRDRAQPADSTLPELWQDGPLPPAWPDRARSWARLLRWPFATLLGRYPTAELPEDLPTPSPVPAYAREAFHGLPNGYYSHDIVKGYDRGFELVMLGQVAGARRRMVEAMTRRTMAAPDGARAAEEHGPPSAAAPRTLRRTLDIGCGSGRLALEMRRAGIEEVWGIDPSPYMLQRALRRVPDARFTQGVIERTRFPDAYFDAAGACFVFHELPGDVARRALDELARVLRPGGVLCITDPCREHFAPRSRWELWRRHGFRGLYFHVLARLVYEPFLADWHSIVDPGRWFDEHGFELVEHTTNVPFAAFVARKR